VRLNFAGKFPAKDGKITHPGSLHNAEVLSARTRSRTWQLRAARVRSDSGRTGRQAIGAK
jgi:hypothetical protein